MANPPDKSRAGDRIAKLLARAGVASRREVERMIEEGRVAVNGVVVSTPATVLASLADVTVDGDPVAAPEPTRLFLYHKPTGVLTAERDPKGRPTIYDRMPKDLPRLVPVGRLDLNTEGLLLMTTDGGLKRQLELPSTGVERAYRARAYGDVTQPQLEALIEGIEIEGVRYGSIDANIERRTGANVWIEMILREGKNREVRRVLEFLGLQVSRLIRTRYGPFIMGDLPPGGIGEVRARDLENFLQTLGQGRASTDQLPPITAGANQTRARLASGTPAEPRPMRGAPVAANARRGAARSGTAPAATTPPTTDARKPAPQRARTAAAPAARPSAQRVSRQTAAERELETIVHTPRPDKPKRLAGWAKAKPPTGPKRAGGKKPSPKRPNPGKPR